MVYYDRIGGPVYSDRYGHRELKQIRNRIRSEFPSVTHGWAVFSPKSCLMTIRETLKGPI
jgi:hypothetical protein